MTSLGPVTVPASALPQRRERGIAGAVDESLGLVDDYLTRPAAELGLLMMGHCTAREAAAFFAKTGAMAVGEHPAAPDPEHARMGRASARRRWAASVRGHRRTRPPPRLPRRRHGAAETRRASTRSRQGLLARGCLRHGLLPRREGKRLKTLYQNRPIPCRRAASSTLKAQLARRSRTHQATRPEIGIVAIADGAADNWTFLDNIIVLYQ